VLAASPAILESGDQDPFVEVRHRAWRGQRPQQGEDSSASTDLRRTRRTTLDMRRQARRVRRVELIEQECVDQFSRMGAVQGVATVRARHNPYMT
jgi:hypothetical protein